MSVFTQKVLGFLMTGVAWPMTVNISSRRAQREIFELSFYAVEDTYLCISLLLCSMVVFLSVRCAV